MENSNLFLFPPPPLTHAPDKTSEPMRSEDELSPASASRGSYDDLSGTYQQGNCPYLIVHEVQCDKIGRNHDQHGVLQRFFDTPRLFAGDNKVGALRGNWPITDIEGILEEDKKIKFIVYRSYACSTYHTRIKNEFEQATVPNLDPKARSRIRPYLSVLTTTGPPAAPLDEWIEVVDDELHGAIVRAEALESGHFKGWMTPSALRSPYLGFYHSRNNLGDLFKGLSKADEDLLWELFEYIHESCSEEFNAADKLFEKGMVNKKHHWKLFAPKTVVVRKHEGSMVCTLNEKVPLATDLVNSNWSWKFDGIFRRDSYWLSLTWPGSDDEDMAIVDLPAYPLKYDRTGLEERLRTRGRTFWDCRIRKYISYFGASTAPDSQITPPRYMVDIDTYRRMHSDEELDPRNKDDLSEESMNAENPPDDPFLLLLPAKIQGYGFHDKKWRLLCVEHIGPVVWNKRAFDRVVLQPHKKELIKALVTVHLSTIADTDIINDKGQGLIMLFHGGPGTGKTLTAETVADLAQKPLYRVTCGDIGTEPESVEKYLDSVLYIGTIWECVVLLDEADVFLEERTLTDLQRNALVSVFLRVLEYYQGIIILTSNRVGTFDEAFKSRVQLSLHYPGLDEKGRWRIWQNFIQGLSKAGHGDNIEIEDIKDKLDILARYKLNGRQIRNIVKTARQLAQYRKEELAFNHFESAIEVANEFEEYLKKTHGHTDEEYARAQHTRY